MSRAPHGTFRYAFSAIRARPWSRFGLLLFGCIIHASIWADFLASSEPIVARSPQGLHLLANVHHDAALQAARDAGEPVEVLLGPLLPHGPNETSQATLWPPLRSASHPLGTDSFGRDVAARLLHGSRVLTGLALAITVLLMTLGTVLGAIAGYFRGPFDALVQRVLEVMAAFPTVLLVLCLQALSGSPSKLFLVSAVALARLAEVVRVVRAEVLQVSTLDYVTAARAVGASPLRILFWHVTPNARAQAVASGSFSLSQVVLAIATCDFLGFGLSQIAPTWGGMMAELREHPTAWWLLAWPVLSLLLLVLSQTLVSETLQDAMDPRERTRGPR